MKKKILKKNGALVEFEKPILIRSLVYAGADIMLAKSIASQIESEISDGDSTVLIYQKAFNMLHAEARTVAMRYSLKKALFDFGPTGFPFEKFVAELFKRKGYSTTTNVHLRGRCIEHEVDVLAVGNERIAFEAKFHNDIRTRTDVKVLLYVKSRFDDLLFASQAKSIFSAKPRGVVDRCMLVTNTKFSRSATTYARCAGVEIMGWGYPLKGNLQDLIQEVDAHPVTCLTSLSSQKLREMFDQNIMTCRSLLENKDVLNSLTNKEAVEEEANLLCRADRRN